MKLLHASALAVATAAALMVGGANAACYEFYEGLCPGSTSCQCTLKEACGAGGGKAKATDAAGKCSGTCMLVEHDRCPGSKTCLQAGPVCGGNVTTNPIQCAQTWVDEQIPYCQCNGEAECCGTCPYCASHFRCDCSGYVSFCLGLNYGYNTRTLVEVTHPITKDELLPGDIMLCTTDHVVFFAGWTDSSKTNYVCYQEPGCHTSGPHHAMKSVMPYPFNWNADCFKPYRVNNNTMVSLGGGSHHGSQSFAQSVLSTAEKVRLAKQPSLHVPDLAMSAIAPRALVEEAAKTPFSYPPQYEAEATAAAAKVREHLKSLGIDFKH